MPLIRKPFWYSKELTRCAVQLLSCFSGYQVVTGIQADGERRFLDVPMIWGNASKVGAFILRGGSDNSMSYVPCGALLMTGLKRDDDNRRTSYHSEKINYLERAMNADGIAIAGAPGVKKTIERFMPVAHKMNFEVSYWCSNQDQQFQLMEQIGAIYAVSMDFLMSNSPVDWTHLRWMTWTGEYQLGMADLAEAGGKTDPYYTVTFPFEAGIWMGVPAKVYETNYIQSIHVPIHELNRETDWDNMPILDELVIKASPEDILRFANIKAAPMPVQEE